VAEKTDRSKKASGRSQAGKIAKPVAKRAAKKAARKTAATASKPKKTAARKPAAGKGRKRTAKAAVKDLAIAKEEIAARRIAGGQGSKTDPKPDPKTAASNAPANQHPIGVQAVVAGTDRSAAAPPAGGQPAAVGRVPESIKRSKTESHTRSGESAESSLRPSTLVPTNGIHTTERRLKRKLHQNRGVMGLVAATLLGIIILGEQTTAPDLTNFEQEITASQAIETDAGSWVANSPPGIINPESHNETVVISEPETSKISERQNKNLNDGELVEMERLLARLDLGPSTADGIVDYQTEAAIRLYQEIAGLPVDGAPSRSLLADIREVVKILEDGG
jgi:hypothetical protein